MRIAPRVSLHFENETPTVAQAGDGELRLRCARDEAFGDGSHPTTRLCAGALDLLSRQLSARGQAWACLDVGTGTAVLARIARARGASLVVGTDIDPVALDSAARHAAMDEATLEQATLPIEISNALPDHWGPRFDLVVANILEAPLKELAPRLAGALGPGGVLLISGFTRLQVPSLRTALELAGLEFASESSLDDWALLQFRRARPN